jgi:hypothetical protein
LLGPAAVLAEAARVLSSANYRLERETEKKLDLPSERALLAEDKYGVVVVVVYDTWRELASAWREAQAAAVEALSARFSRLDRKAWDGYLVLLTPALATDHDATVHEIRYDTSRIRKIVATGDDLVSLNDVERALLPLLPLAQNESDIDEAQSPLDELPEQLEQTGIARELAETAVAAFRAHRPIVHELHRHLSGK